MIKKMCLFPFQDGDEKKRCKKILKESLPRNCVWACDGPDSNYTQFSVPAKGDLEKRLQKEQDDVQVFTPSYNVLPWGLQSLRIS